MSTHVIPSRPEFAAILRDQHEFAVAGRDTLGNRLNGWFDRLMIQSGADLAPAMLLALCLCSAVACGGLAFVVQENLLTTAIGALIGAAAPLVTAVIIRSRRQSEMLKQFPAMLDELARAARTGRSLEKCLALVADDTPQPLGGELRRCTRRLDLGMSITDALGELPLRTGLASTNVFVSALAVHRETGGDLVKVLERLAQTLRTRIQFQGRLKAATAASRATALLMLIVPPAVLAFFIFRDPEYLTNLMQSEWGFRVTIMAAVLQIVGSLWVLRILKSSGQG
ncbi:MAG: type II secretion system F family protein [Planctomycetaceae bacterium]|nr:type II secretion system F family protein [Planctomycetaceae bacterium]